VVVQLADNHSPEPIDAVAASVLETLYAGVFGQSPLALRAYGDEGSVLLLLRFKESRLDDTSPTRVAPLIDISFMAMPELIAESVHELTGRTLVPGNLSVCAERGLAVFAFAVLDEARVDDRDELFALGSGLRLAMALADS
jgi:hypothetical protein